MKCFAGLPLMLAAGAAIGGSPPASAASSCDRNCLRHIADGFVASIVAHAPAALDMSPVYIATENSVPAAPDMMTIWQTATAAKAKFYVLDAQSEQAFIAVTVAEGAHDALLWGRLKVNDGKLAEIEIYVERSRSDAGFQLDADGLASLPIAWTEPVAASRLPSRAELLQAGRAIFDTSVTSPPAAPGCVLMENAKIVEENPDVLKSVGNGLAGLRNADGLVSIPCGIPPGRPTDRLARTDIADTQQGIVVSIATVQGAAEPYVVTTPTQSAFVPDAMLRPYVTMLSKQLASGQYTRPMLRPTPASITVAELHRVFDGKVQGMEMLQKLGPRGGQSPWTTDAAQP